MHWWLLGVNAFVVVFPVGALFALRLYDNYLVRQTERQLIAQSVVVGETWRSLLERHHGPRPGVGLDFRPPGQSSKRFVPIEPVLNLTQRTSTSPARDEEDLPWGPLTDAGLAAVVRSMEVVLRRAQVFNLSAVRILDAHGCVLATTRGYRQRCLTGEEEVARALNGRYWAVARQRHSDEPRPWLSDIRRRGDTRIFTALPIFADGRVLAVVHMSRTSLDAVSSLWANRRGLVLLFGATLLLTAVVSFVFAAAVARPLRLLTRAARAIAAGGSRVAIPQIGLGPAEVHSLRTALDQMTTELTRRADYIAEFAANMSHELKTPLTGIRGATELLRDEWSSMTGVQRGRFIDNIADDAERMQRLVDGVLDLARIRAVADAQQDIDIAAFVEALRRRYPAVQFNDEGVAPGGSISMNPDHLLSAVGNLVDNALVHGGDQARPPEVAFCDSDGLLVIRVRDFGAGISPANQAQIFERFFTTRRDEGGTGLGLAVVHSIAESRGGSVVYRSVPGGGAEFVLTI